MPEKVIRFEGHVAFPQYPLVIHALNAIASISQVVIGLSAIGSAIEFVATRRLGAFVVVLVSMLGILMIHQARLRFNRQRLDFELRVLRDALEAIGKEIESREQGEGIAGSATNVYEPGKWK